MATNYTFKIVLVGDGGVGKTTFVKRLLTGDFTKKYVATLGVEVHPLKFSTNYGVVSFNVWDTAGQEKFGGLRDGYYILADGALVFFSVVDEDSYRSVEKWDTEVRNVLGDVPTILCGNKVDIGQRVVCGGQITYHKQRGIKYYDISAKSNYNIEKPFLALARQLTGHNDLKFIENDAIAPPIVELDEESIRRYKRELEEASELTLPDL